MFWGGGTVPSQTLGPKREEETPFRTAPRVGPRVLGPQLFVPFASASVSLDFRALYKCRIIIIIIAISKTLNTPLS